MSRLEIALLGPPEIRVDGNLVKTDRRKAIALLAYLAVSGKPHTRDALAAMFWPDYERDSAYAYLRRTLWELNQMLGKGWIEADRETVQLVGDSDFWLDTVEFENTIKRLSAAGDESAQLEADITLYRGDFMVGFIVADTAPFEDWQNQQAEYFRRSFANALEKLIDARTNVGEYETAVPHARRWLALDALNESAHRSIMRLLAAMGDRAGAIHQYETCVRTLKDELGITPQSETIDLYQAILNWEIFGMRKPLEIPQQTEYRPVSRLPQMPTPFIGRRPEVEQVKSLVTNPNHRLVTLVGPGGTGKTRLSIQVASEVEDTFANGIFFAPLVAVQNLDAILPTVAKALDFSFYREGETHRQQLLDFLREKKLLLILDNFEHLLSATDLVTDILSYAADVKLIVTSRVRLNVQGEQLFAVAGMHMPNAAEIEIWDDPEVQAKPFSAIQLFLDRARRVQPGFRITNENVRSVLAICRLVQGMPLGLELAAGWLELLPPEEIVAEIARSLDFLETDQADVPERQRSVRAVFESSWKLLTDGERETFLRLCVFVGSFSREAAQQVSGASLKTLLGLANKSWLQQTAGSRFQLHELMRQYGEERLRTDETAWREAKNLHADYFAKFVARQSEKMSGSEQPAGLKAIDEEFEGNIKAAWYWLVAEKRWSEIIDHFLLGLFQFGTALWRTDEMIPWFREARLTLESEVGQAQSPTFVILGTLEVYCEERGGIKDTDPLELLATIWDLVTKYDLGERMGFWYMLLLGLRHARNPDPGLEGSYEKGVAWLRAQNLRWGLGLSLLVQGNWWGLYSYNEGKLLEALEIFKELEVVYEQGIIYQLLGRHAFQQKRLAAEITNYFRKALEFDRQLGGQPSISIDWLNLAGIYFQQGETEQGFALLHEIQRTYERIGNLRLLVAILNWEGLYAIRYSTLEHTLEVRQRGLELARKRGNLSDLTWQTFEMGDVYRIAGEVGKALELYQQASINFEKMNLVLGLGYYQRAQGDIALKDGRYLDALNRYQEFARYAAQDNHLWSMGQAHAKLALVHAYSGNLKDSRFEIHNAISLMRDWREDDLILQVLLAEPVCLKCEGKLEEAIALSAFIAHHPISWNETKQQARAILETASQGLPKRTIQAAIERGKELDLDSVVANLIHQQVDQSPD